MPDVTVLMAIYNAMPHLPAAVESIRAQTHRNWKMVIVNDGSTDESANYLAQLADPRIQVVHEQNRGLGPALNRGLDFCNTEFTARMDGDDVSHPTRLKKQIAFLRQHPEVGLVGTQVERMGSRRSAGVSLLACDHETIYADVARGNNQMYHPTIMCRTALMKEIGGYWDYPKSEDTDFVLRMGERTRLANLNHVLLSYRFHTGSLTGSGVANMRSWVEYACHCAQRRRAGLELVSYEAFADKQRATSWFSRLPRRLQMHARAQYRAAVGEVLGQRPLVGSLRLAYSAIWSPSLSYARVFRVCRRWLRRDVPKKPDRLHFGADATVKRESELVGTRS